MGPKIEAALRFAWWSRREAIITSLGKALEGILGKTGTRITP
jgi:carbamate kinase